MKQAGVLYELRLMPIRRSPFTASALSERLIAQGLAPTAVVEQDERGRRSVSAYLPSAAAARRWQARLQRTTLRGVRMRTRRLRKADWQDTWKRHLRPFAITPHLRLVPAWSREARQGPDRKRIVLETGLAFGTGKHETTKSVAQFIASVRGRFKDALDIGVGTGILSVIAHRYGARRIVGIDTDREAVEVSRRNLLLNGCPDARLMLGDFARQRLRRRFDLVVANLTTDTLLTLRKPIIAAIRPGKYLAISGVARNNLARFRRGFEDRSLRCLRLRLGTGWASLLYRRRLR